MAEAKKTPVAKRAKAVGKPLDWPDGEIDRLADVTPEDVAAAKAVYRRLAPKRAKRLLDAREADE